MRRTALPMAVERRCWMPNGLARFGAPKSMGEGLALPPGTGPVAVPHGADFTEGVADEGGAVQPEVDVPSRGFDRVDTVAGRAAELRGHLAGDLRRVPAQLLRQREAGNRVVPHLFRRRHRQQPPQLLRFEAGRLRRSFQYFLCERIGHGSTCVRRACFISSTGADTPVQISKARAPW